MALKTAIILSGKVQVIAVVGAVAVIPAKTPLKKLKSHESGVNKREKNSVMFDKTYLITFTMS